MADENIERIAKKIEVLSEAALRSRGLYLLSELGKDLGPDLSTLKLLTNNGSLSAFIRERFPDKFIVAQTGQFKNVQALIRSPNSKVELLPSLTVSEKVIFETEVLAKPSPRFNYRFWAAFSVPHREGKRCDESCRRGARLISHRVRVHKRTEPNAAAFAASKLSI